MSIADRTRLAAMAPLIAVGKPLLRLLLAATLAVLTFSNSACFLHEPAHERSQKTKEAGLRWALFTLREQIDNYTLDKEKAPQSLRDLVTAGYLKAIPVDPFTGSNETWVPVTEDINLSVEQTETGITDVHSGSNATGSDGTAYSSW